MYRGGLTRGQIAKLVDAATSTVGYHLAAARADPQLQSAHEAAPALRTTQSSRRCLGTARPGGALDTKTHRLAGGAGVTLAVVRAWLAQLIRQLL